jgi:peroxiredoxin/GNAT superfamily N-acetyltransferase
MTPVVTQSALSASSPTIPYRDDLRRVERAGFFSWPATETANVDGWVWRSSGGGYGRTNSTFTLDFDGGDVGAAIAKVEAYYQMRGRRARFRVSEVSEPVGLADALRARGYTIERPCLIMAKATQFRRPDLTGVEWTPSPSPNWLRVYFGVIDEARRLAAPDILARIPAPLAYFSCRRRGITLSCGLATIEDGIATVECMATREETRRRGGARAILGGIETWAHEEGAHTLHLEVMASNVEAVALYRSFGFEQVGTYSYWVADAMATAPLDDGAAAHLKGWERLASVSLPSTRGEVIDPAALPGRAVVVVYPWTGRTGLPNPPAWDEILGAHGSTPQLEGFRDRHEAFQAAGVRVLAVSGQTTEHQRELVERLKLPFDVLSDATSAMRAAWKLPVFTAGKQTLLRRLTLVLNDGVPEHCFHPVHPPTSHADEVLAWLAANRL